MAKDNINSLYSKHEVAQVLISKNAARTFLSALVMIPVIAAFMILSRFAGFFGDNSDGYRIFLSVMMVSQIAMAAVGYFLIRDNDMDKLVDYSRAEYLLVAVMIAVTGTMDIISNAGILIMVMGALYLAIVPIMDKLERRIYILGYVAVSIASAAVFSGETLLIVELAAASALMLYVAEYIQQYMISSEKTRIKLKVKTITSESDPLTGLMNRRGLNKRAGILWPYCSRTSTTIGMIEIDIDFFKKFNDRFGHPAGDRCIKMVASAIKKSARRSSDISARTGGEEFVIFTQGTSEKELIGLAMKIRTAIDELRIPHAYVNVSNYVTVSMGVSIITPNSSNSYEQLYENTDKALYKAKSNGRNCIVCGNRIYGRMTKGNATFISV